MATSWTERTSPTTNWDSPRVNEGGSPIGLLLALTYPDRDILTTSWSVRSEPSTSWTLRIEP